VARSWWPIYSIISQESAVRIAWEAEVVEAEFAESGLLQRGFVAVAELVASEVAARGSAEDKVVVGRVVLAFVQLGRHREDDGSMQRGVSLDSRCDGDPNA
jgi:hypothetical protein